MVLCTVQDRRQCTERQWQRQESADRSKGQERCQPMAVHRLGRGYAHEEQERQLHLLQRKQVRRIVKHKDSAEDCKEHQRRRRLGDTAQDSQRTEHEPVGRLIDRCRAGRMVGRRQQQPCDLPAKQPHSSHIQPDRERAVVLHTVRHQRSVVQGLRRRQYSCICLARCMRRAAVEIHRRYRQFPDCEQGRIIRIRQRQHKIGRATEDKNRPRPSWIQVRGDDKQQLRRALRDCAAQPLVHGNRTQPSRRRRMEHLGSRLLGQGRPEQPS